MLIAPPDFPPGSLDTPAARTRTRSPRAPSEAVRDTVAPGELIRATDPRLRLDLDFTVGEPVDKYAVEALLVERWAQVMPMTWTATWLDGIPDGLRRVAGGFACACEPQGCPDCAAENRAARRARRRFR